MLCALTERIGALDVTFVRPRPLEMRDLRNAAIKRSGNDCAAEPKPWIAPPVSSATRGEPATTPRTATPAPGNAPTSE
jgi:hypothetical protein